MHLRVVSVIAVFALSAKAFGIAVLYPTDPSLQGTTIAAETFTIDTQGFGERVPPPVPVFFVDEKIVKNTTGTRDGALLLDLVTIETTEYLEDTEHPLICVGRGLIFVDSLHGICEWRETGCAGVAAVVTGSRAGGFW